MGIGFDFALRFREDHSPSLYVSLSLLFLWLELEIYNVHHADEESEARYRRQQKATKQARKASKTVQNARKQQKSRGG
jgi:hypothetical protein